MWKPVKKIIEDQNGAVTVDWVVLSAVILGLGATTYAVMEDGVDGFTTNFSTAMNDSTIDIELN